MTSRSSKASCLCLALFALAGACQQERSPAAPAMSGGGNAGQAVGGTSSEPAAAGSATGGGGNGAAMGGSAAASALALSLGPFSTCAIDAQSKLRCAGRCGASGNGGSRDKAPEGLLGRAVAVGRNFACALLLEPQGGSLVSCWGDGVGVQAPPIADAVEIVAGDEHACTRASVGAVTCWGDPAHAAPQTLVAKSLSASGAMTCAIVADDSVQCWGVRPAAAPSDLRARSLAVSSQLTDPKLGPRFGCAVALAGDVRCWGDDPGGVQTVPSPLKAKAIATGRSHACAIGADDVVTCWGTSPRFGAPLPVGLQARALSMSFRSAGAIQSDGTFAFWGDISDGRSTL